MSGNSTNGDKMLTEKSLSFNQPLLLTPHITPQPRSRGFIPTHWILKKVLIRRLSRVEMRRSGN